LGLPAWNAGPAWAVGIMTGVLGYLAALGLFGQWARWFTGAAEKPEAVEAVTSWTRFLRVSTNHKVIGVQYLATALLFLPVAVILQLIGRVDLSKVGLTLSAESYSAIVSDHGIIMLFIVALPAFAGLMNYFVPLQIGARDMAFPRLNALSFWLVPAAGLLTVAALAAGGFDTGWTIYPPLSTAYQPLGMDLVLIGVYLAGLSSILSAINILTTVIKMRAPGMGIFRMPLFVWTAVSTTILSLLFTQFVAMALLFVLLERLTGMPFYNPGGGGQPLLYQYMFWFYSHPATYIFALPGLGIISEIMPVFSRKPLFGYRAVAVSSLGIAIGGTLVFGHHMFAAGIPALLRIPFMATTMLVAVPTGVKVFAWLATAWGGKLRMQSPLLFALSAIVIFLVGGLTGVMQAVVPVDLYVHDTYWIVGHFHSVLFGGFLFPLMAGLYYWFPKMSGRRLSERLGRAQWWLMTAGAALLIMPMFVLGLDGLRRRTEDYANMSFQPLVIVTAMGGFLLFFGLAVLYVNILRSLKRGEEAGHNPWEARTLEWMVSSPPPARNFAALPEVTGAPYDFSVPSAVHAVLMDSPDTPSAGGKKV
jgi:cytochrome c oxidase subunit I